MTSLDRYPTWLEMNQYTGENYRSVHYINTESSIRGRFSRGLGGAKPPNIRPFVGKSHYARLEARKTGITKCFLNRKKQRIIYI